MPADRRSQNRPRRPGLRLDSLEDRAVFSAGAPDLTFGADGIRTTPIGNGGESSATAVAVQADGKVVVAGSALHGSSYQFAVVRYHPDGSPDLSFSVDGEVLTPVGSSADFAHAVAVQADGRIVVAGSSGDGSDDQIALVRYNPDGSLDPTFGGDGTVTTAVGGRATAYAVAVQADGRVVAAGQSWDGSGYDFALVRYLSDGTLDLSFGGDGTVTTPIRGGSDMARGLAVQADGRLVVVGFATAAAGTNPEFALARYLPDGSLDPSFGGDGKVTTAFAGADAAHAVAVQADGRIVAAGSAWNGTDEDFAVARYHPDGSADLTFDGDGRVTIALGTDTDMARGLAVQADGKVVVAGTSVSLSNTGYDFALARFNPDGSRDQGFGDFGTLTTPVGPGTSEDFAHGLAVQADGSILVAGQSQTAGGNGFALVRYQPDGSLDSLADGNGTVTTYVGPEGGAQGIAIQADGKIVVVGSSNAGYQYFTLARYNADGSPDANFGEAGQVRTLFGGWSATAYGVAIQADGKIVAVGRSNNNDNSAFAVARYNADGSLDSTFDGDGKITTTFDSASGSASGVVIAADGRILVVGTAWPDHAVFGLARYLPDGRLDVTFDGDGRATSPTGGSAFARGVTVRADGKIAVAGYLTVGSNTDVLVYQFNPDGSPDTYIYEDSGPSDDRADAMAIQGDGKIVVAGSSFNGTDTDFFLARYHADGSPDATFSGDGKLTTPIGAADDVARSLAIQADGKIVVAGSAVLGGNELSALARYLPDGSLDPSFDGDGTLTAPVGGANAVAIQGDGKIVAAGGNGSFALLRVRGDNHAPVAVPTTLTAAEDGTLVVARPAYFYDPDNDLATVELLVAPTHGALTLTPYGTFAYTPAPNFNGTDQFTYRVSDTFGGSAVGTVGLDVTPVAEAVEVSDDPALPGKKSLFVTGTPGDDAILVKPVGLSRTAYLVTRNGGPAEPVSGVTGRVYVAGLEGSDSIQLKAVRIPARLDGGPGNDTLVAGAGADFLTGGPGDDSLDGGGGTDRLVESGDVDFTLVQGTAQTNGRLTGLGADVLVRNRVEQADLTGGPAGNRIDASAFTGRTWLRGGGGADTLRGGRSIDLLLGGDGDDDLDGGAGRDVLIAGLGADRVAGGAGADLLIGGWTTHQGNATALDAILAEWAGRAGYAARVRHLLGTLAGGRNGGFRLDATTVLDDAGAADSLTGGLGRDWFGTGPGDTSDRTGPEQTLTV